MKGARPAIPVRPRDAALGRETRGLVGPARGGARAAPRVAGGRLRGPARLLRPARAAGLLGMLASGFLFSFVTGPTAFGLTRTDLPELAWTDPALVRETLGLTEGGNVFRLETGSLVTALRALPAVASAEVSIALPDAAVVVRIDERVPVLAWQVGDTRSIADPAGTIFATLDGAALLPEGVPVIDDRRTGARALAIGATVDAVDFDVATRLGSLTPADVGSSAVRLRVAITDLDGFVLSPPGDWTAVFGFYSPATRATDMIPGQVRLLRSLLAGREATPARIILASETVGTYVPRATPRPSP
jgi:hypothetical protein